MNKRNRSKVMSKPFEYNDSINVYYELEFGRDVIKPGDKIKFKHSQGLYVFYKWVHNSQLDVTWIDCMDMKTYEFKSFYMEKLKGVHRAKKSIRKKLV